MKNIKEGFVKHLKKSYEVFLGIVVLILLGKVLYSAWLISGGISVGTFFASLGVVLIFAAFSYLFSVPKRKWYLTVINLLISALLLADLMYFDYFGKLISIHVFFQVSNLSGLGPSIVSLLKLEYIVLFLDLLMLPILFRYRPRRSVKNKTKFGVILTVATLILISMPFKYVYVDQVDAFDSTDPLSFGEDWGPLGHHILDTYTYINEGQSLELNEDQEREIIDWFHQKNATEKQNEKITSYKGVGEGKNLIVIQFESLQNFVIGQKVNGEEITPHLNKLADEGLYFSRFYPQTIEGNSSDAELLINTSLYPIQHGSTYYRFPDNDYISLPHLLKEKGYRTLAIHGDKASFWNRDKVYPHLGFDEYLDITHFEVDEEIGMGLSDLSMFRQSIPMLKAETEPFYAFLITLTSHMPFEMPKEHQYLDLPIEMKDTLIGDYVQSIRYADEALGYFMEEMRKEGLLDDSIVVVFGDHAGIHRNSIELMEQLWAEEEISDEEWFRTYASVPLMIYHPDLKGEKMDVVGGQVDLLPTLAYVMGIDPERIQNSAMGRNLLTQQWGSAIIPNGDYSGRAYITQDEILLQLTEEQEKTLEVSDMIIRSNFFNRY